MRILIEILVRVSVFYDYWIENSITNRKFRKAYFLQIIYSLILTTPIGLVIFLFFSIGGSYLWDIQQSSNLGWLFFTLFFFIILNLILFTNFKEKEFNIAQLILNFFFVISYLKENKNGFGIKNAIIFIIISTLLLSSASIYAFYFTFPTILNAKSAICIVVICILLSTFIFSESSTNVFQRSVRQIVLFLMVFLTLLFATLYEVLKSTSDLGSLSIPALFLLLFGLIFNLATIGDKLRDFYTVSMESFGIKIIEIRQFLHENYSLQKEFHQSKKALAGLYFIWNIGSRRDKVKIIGVSIIFIIIYVLLVIFFISS
ncbi:hypothetical protein [Cytobacillus sp. FSL H8-0458]|uniref:hypothetical protein n=1 Tax=Cytobacillus sp. FSL H8-0458 TaxID=2975346 RepID=UPI0030F81EA1